MKSTDNKLAQENNKKKIPLVLIHGWGLNSGIWQPFIDKFVNNDDNQINLEIITIDLPGFGVNSGVSLTPYSLANICQFIAKEVDQPAVYLGWSLGGLVATQMTLDYPDKVLGLITVASSPKFTEDVNSETKIITDWPGIKVDVLDGFYHQLSDNVEKTLNNFLKIQAMGSPHIRQDLKEIKQLVMQHKLPTQQTLTDSLQLLSNTDFRQQIAKIKQPFLRLYGANDSLVPKKVIALINSLAIDSEYKIFNGASHAPFISHADDFYKLLSNWLESHYTQR